MAKLVDALASGASVRKDLGVRISLEAHSNFFHISFFFIGDVWLFFNSFLGFSVG